jgi:hypothetical protein
MTVHKLNQVDEQFTKALLSHNLDAVMATTDRNDNRHT